MKTINYIDLVNKTIYIKCLHHTSFGFTITMGVYTRGDKQQHLFLN